MDSECKKYDPLPYIIPNKHRVIVIGDLQGDWKFTIDTLKLAKVIDDKLKWIGKDTYVVQVGDQIDRCRANEHECTDPRATINDEDSDTKIMKFYVDLHLQARKEDGAVIALLGNHELMNVDGNMNYVSYKNIHEFDNYKDPETGKLIKNGYEARKYAFEAGHEYGKFLGCTHPASIIIGDNLFVHAGLISKYAKKLKIENRDDLMKVNDLVRKWLLGKINYDNIIDIIESFKINMFWNRILGNIPPDTDMSDPVCYKNLKGVLKLLKVGHIIIGHTPQNFTHKTGINGTCDDTVWRVDIGASQAFDSFDNFGDIKDNKLIQVLEIIDGKHFNVLK